MEIQKVSKAIAGALASLLVVWLAKYNYVVDGTLKDAVDVVLTAAIGFLIVYISPKNKV